MVSQAVDLLEVKQKRRIYDITNVLEGIGLIEKESKNSIRWKSANQSIYIVLDNYYITVYYRGATPGPESNEVCNQLEQLKEKLAIMKEQERELEEQCEKMQVCLKNTMESIADKQYPHQ